LSAARVTSLLAFASLLGRSTVSGQSGPLEPDQNKPRLEAAQEKSLGDIFQQADEAEASGRLVEAEKLEVEALQEAEKLGGENPKVATVLMRLADLYIHKNQAQQGMSCAERALAIDERNFGPRHPRVARDLSNMISLSRQAQRPEDADKYASRALEIEQNAPGMSDVERLFIIGNAAELYRSQKRYAEAEALLRRGLEIAEHTEASMPRSVGDFRTRLASLYREEGKPNDAEKLLYDSVVQQPTADQNGENPDLSSALNAQHLARHYKDEGRLHDAEEYYNRSIAIMVEIPGTDARVLLSPVLAELGETYRAEGRDSEAKKLFLRALSLTEHDAASGRADLAQLLTSPNNLLDRYRHEGRLSDIEPVFQRALEIQRRVLGPKAPTVGQTLRGLAQAYREEGKFPEARSAYDEALQIAEKNLAPDDPQLRFLREEYAALLQQAGQQAR
jgi:tetratricopeptide (TPR) repeat protein